MLILQQEQNKNDYENKETEVSDDPQSDYEYTIDECPSIKKVIVPIKKCFSMKKAIVQIEKIDLSKTPQKSSSTRASLESTSFSKLDKKSRKSCIEEPASNFVKRISLREVNLLNPYASLSASRPCSSKFLNKSDGDASQNPFSYEFLNKTKCANKDLKLAQKSKERRNKSREIFAYTSDSDENDELEKPVLKKFKKIDNSIPLKNQVFGELIVDIFNYLDTYEAEKCHFVCQDWSKILARNTRFLPIRKEINIFNINSGFFIKDDRKIFKNNEKMNKNTNMTRIHEGKAETLSVETMKILISNPVKLKIPAPPHEIDILIKPECFMDDNNVYREEVGELEAKFKTFNFLLSNLIFEKHRYSFHFSHQSIDFCENYIEIFKNASNPERLPRKVVILSNQYKEEYQILLDILSQEPNIKKTIKTIDSEEVFIFEVEEARSPGYIFEIRFSLEKEFVYTVKKI
uniref:F-box domain-containing protein n=1 Tax=Acrobeloides nanus TaxID=290746 RepID=A0A914DHH3_9BILA